MSAHQRIVILDFGSQYTQLIARRVRELAVYSEIRPFTVSPVDIQAMTPSGIILSGGPRSVYDEGAPRIAPEVLELGVPVLGICYGLQLITEIMGGQVAPAEEREYGPAELLIDEKEGLTHDLPDATRVWMSHGDRVERLPHGFKVVGHTSGAPYAAIRHQDRPVFGLQFHPEVTHTKLGTRMLGNFLFQVCGCRGDWSPAAFVYEAVERIAAQAPEHNVICALSGGVDSLVAAELTHRAVGERLHCVYVDTGLMRKNESEEVGAALREIFGHQYIHADAADDFLAHLHGITDPEEKRRRIGHKFIETFDREAKRIGDAKYLVQGTLYPDRIESAPVKGPSATIKTHHNVGGLPEKMALEVVEPLAELFKDEVRRVGAEMGLPPDLLGRHPFPGPGLAVRTLGAVERDQLDMLREADAILIQELKDSGWYDKVWQAFAVLLPIQTVGVMGDERTYENVIVLRSVDSQDGMTADWSRLPHDLLAKVSNRIINEVQGVNRVAYDISSKPPSTIEWE